ncbi:TIGR03915 family putative DNA repair protein [Spirosoma validum]|uniref:TIGR03915 family putative DNA repair protein n=1 Tax=Spirosoma validum TaxID=2771355 RepID=A0A927GCL7_9BACT|nr:TIGR03915 family putative DNA repair protein [Spirosoma validum]MBD2752887.1 TIGR03915 family putative DNA repair protein [Spirosoma validum]
MIVYVYDGGFQGLLTAIFEAFARKQDVVKLTGESRFEPGFFDTSVRVRTESAKAERVWLGLQKKIGVEGQQRFYKAFLSEQAEVLQHLFKYAQYVFRNPDGYAENYGNDDVLAMAQAAQKVHREKHRMEAFVRFKKHQNGLFMATIYPDFNVLPLICQHFKDRYADQPWVIYDERRDYGIYYNGSTICEVVLASKPRALTEQDVMETGLDSHELLYTTLWKDYFQSTNITERKNKKLHLQHVPKRYWRYLTEKMA